MKKIIIMCLVGGLFLALSNTAMAYVTIDPTTGWIGDFQWAGGLGPMDAIDGDYSETAWGIAMAHDGWLDLATVDNDYIGGDEFALYVDSSLVAWDNEYYTGPFSHPTLGDQYFYHGDISGLWLTAGTHTIYMVLTKLAPATTTGAAHASFSSVTYVPAPGAILLGSIGVGLVGWLRRKRAL